MDNQLPNKILNASIYARVSTQEQAQDKASIPDQLEVCHKVIREKGWGFTQEYDDRGISGHLVAERHGLQSLLRDAREHKFDLIVIKDYDRFARNKDAAAVIRQELKSLGIQVYAINTPVEPKPVNQYDPDDDDSTTIMETISDMRADLERMQIMRRMKMGKMSKAKSGAIPNNVPFGYRVIRTLEGAKVKRTIVVCEDEAPRVKFIFNEYTRGVGIRKIAIELNRKGWKPSRGQHWTISSVRYILANPTYIGKVWWGWRHALYKKTKEYRRRGKVGYTGPGNHLPIIEEAQFNLAQEIRAGRVKNAPGGTGRSLGLLTGIAKCIRCGSGVGYQTRRHKRSDKNPKWNDTITHEYICTGYKYKGICTPRVMSAEKLEGQVLDHVRNLYSHPKVQERIVYDGKSPLDVDREKEVQMLDREIALEPVKMQRQHDAYERGIISLEEYEANLWRIREEMAKNRTEQSNLLNITTLNRTKASSIQKLVNSMKNFDTAWAAMELDEKKLILRSIIKEIRAGQGKVEIDFIL